MVVVYEDGVAHDCAMEMGNRLAAQFGEEPTFVFNSWNFKQLAEPETAGEAVEAASRADVIIISTHGNELPWAVGAWLESCVKVRSGPEGALALLLAEPLSLSTASGTVVARLELTARRMRMDFLPLMPAQAEELIKTLQERANIVTTTMKEMLDQPAADHWGLNE